MIYGTSITASQLIQDSRYRNDIVFEYEDIAITINSPVGNVPYRYYPGFTGEVSFVNMACGRSARSTIKVGGITVEMAYTIADRSPYGAWEIVSY